MGLEEELLRIAKKLEKMVARKKTVRLQSLQRNPWATEERPGQPRAWWACRPCARRERSGLRTGGGWQAARQGSPSLLAGHLGCMCACVARSGEDRVAPSLPPRRDWCKSVWTNRVYSWATCAVQ